MKPITMTESEEAEIRAWDAASDPRDLDNIAKRGRRGLLAELDATRARLAEAERERDEARRTLEEREGDMHMRIRAGYDATIADAWRAKVAEVERERDAARAEVERLTREREQLHAAAATVVDEWDADEIGQVDGATIEALRALAAQGGE